MSQYSMRSSEGEDVLIRAFLSALAVTLALAIIAIINGCGSSPEAKRVEAAGGYKAQQSDCVVNNETRESIDKCRDAVKADWAKDGGK